jgi:DMSO/TMAO reductase YedYZ molybdopterin-dependent catalytic subunit
MMRCRALILVCTVLQLGAFAFREDAAAQAADAVHRTLQVSGDVRTPVTLTVAELAAMPRTRVEIKTDDQRTITYEGVLVGDILKRAGAPSGAELRGEALSTYVVAIGSDGYQVVFSLAELDTVLTGSSTIVADSADGKPLAPGQGPLRLVVPKDTRAARGVRMLERLDVVRVKK